MNISKNTIYEILDIDGLPLICIKDDDNVINWFRPDRFITLRDHNLEKLKV